MGRAAKKRRSDKKKADKRKRKRANYLREGPKAGHVGRRQKRSRYNTFKHSQTPSDKDLSPTPPGRKARRRSAGRAVPTKAGPGGQESKGGRRFARFPLRPLRRRRRISSARPEKRRE
jgi:hypothetical protein